MSNEEIYDSIGFDAILERLKDIYPEQQERHYGTVVPYSLGGNDPLDGISVYKSEKGIPHWHYISFGFTELYEKESDDEEVKTGLKEITVGNGDRLSAFIERVYGQVIFQIFEINAADEPSDGRHDEVIDDGGHNLSESATNDYTNRHIKGVSLHSEVLKLF